MDIFDDMDTKIRMLDLDLAEHIARAQTAATRRRHMPPSRRQTTSLPSSRSSSPTPGVSNMEVPKRPESPPTPKGRSGSIIINEKEPDGEESPKTTKRSQRYIPPGLI
eukprot:945279-Prorocentrum_minimum.AAC.1